VRRTKEGDAEIRFNLKDFNDEMAKMVQRFRERFAENPALTASSFEYDLAELP